MKFETTALIASAVIVGALTAGAPAKASDDYKTIDAATCQPYGPNTTASELVYNQLGVANPGVTNESVLCPLTTDGQVAWSSTAGVSAYMFVYYRAGATPGKVACTAFASKATINAGPVFSVTVNPSANLAANARDYLYFYLGETSGTWNTAPTLVALCTLTPKAVLGGFSLNETVPTNVP